MSLPPFAPFPQARLRQTILPAEWGEHLDSWASLAELYLRLSDVKFSATVSEESSLTSFLISFFSELAEDNTLASSVTTLRKRCFLLIHRIFSGNNVPVELLTWQVLANICSVFPKSEQLRYLLHSLWKRYGENIEQSLQAVKTSIIKTVESKRPEDAENLLNRLGPLLKCSSDAGTFMLTGSDFLDSLNSAYTKVSVNLQKKLVTTVYLGLIALLEGHNPNYSLLLDHLYSLKISGEQDQRMDPAKATFVADLVTNTPILNKIRDEMSSTEGNRVKNIAASLSAFRQPGIARPKRLIRRKVDKGKGKAPDGGLSIGPTGEVHIHRMSLISQIQDLFPHLGSGFVIKLLDEFNEDIEEVTAHLLDGSLPPNLANADQNEQLPATTAMSQPHFTPRSTPPPQRRNVFDDDDFDKLAVDTSRLHIGRKNEKLTADKLLSDRSGAPNKSAILSALAAFDSDDDERDDTYDAEDVGGTVDATADDSDILAEELFRAFSTTPELFNKDGVTRRSKARVSLRNSTGMTDEAIEGWAIMLRRDPRRLRRLEALYSTFSGQQNELASTAYRGSPADSGTEGTEGEKSSGGGGRGGRGGFSGRGRGRGRGRGGGGKGGGNVAGPSEDKSTQVSRQRKEANKGSRANHNRRDQRAKKMARGGLPG